MLMGAGRLACVRHHMGQDHVFNNLPPSGHVLPFVTALSMLSGVSEQTIHRSSLASWLSSLMKRHSRTDPTVTMFLEMQLPREPLATVFRDSQLPRELFVTPTGPGLPCEPQLDRNLHLQREMSQRCFNRLFEWHLKLEMGLLLV